MVSMRRHSIAHPGNQHRTMFSIISVYFFFFFFFFLGEVSLELESVLV